MVDINIKKKRLSELLINLIRESGWSERDLARRLNVSSTSAQGYVDGLTWPNEDNRAKIAKLLGITKAELDARLEGKAIERTQTLEEMAQEIRALSRAEFAQIAKIVFDRAAIELGNGAAIH